MSDSMASSPPFQVCDIGDASRGSLSSYAYILMMLYYLQQVQPPVIPVLQEVGGDRIGLTHETIPIIMIPVLQEVGGDRIGLTHETIPVIMIPVLQEVGGDRIGLTHETIPIIMIPVLQEVGGDE